MKGRDGIPLVEDDGSTLLLSLVLPGGERVSVVLGPAEVVAIAGDLIQAARVRLGRKTGQSS